MNDKITCLIYVPDGRRLIIPFSPNTLPVDGDAAPDWLVSRIMGRKVTDWRLRSLPPASEEASYSMGQLCRSQYHQRFCLVGDLIAGARERAFDPRQARLKKERLALEQLNAESDHVRVTPVDLVEGSEPERYRVAFSCRGISGIDASRDPIYSDYHEVLIVCDDFFPSDVPKLRWETPIWHPNIQHLEPKGVCVNKPEWLGGMGLVDLVRQMFEMVQYKNYHADADTRPFPFDLDVAKWVREYAEPSGIVDKSRNIFVDDRPFTRPTEVKRRIIIVPKAPYSIKVLSTHRADPPTETVPSRIRIKRHE